MELAEQLSAEARSLVEDLCVRSEADLLIFNAQVLRTTHESLLEAVKGRQRRANVYLMLVTEGGDPHAAYMIARVLQQLYQRFVCVLPGYSKSAGTIIVIGAHELVIADEGELGPVDVQLLKEDTLSERESGLTVLTALNTLHEKAFLAWEHFFLAMEQRSGGSITLRTAADVAAKLATGLFSPVYGQINPHQLGEAARAMLIGNEYGKRLDAVARNLRPAALDALVTGYPDHGFVIDGFEARKLFHRVRRPTKLELEVSNKIVDLLEVEAGRERPLIGFLNKPVGAGEGDFVEEKWDNSNNGDGTVDTRGGPEAAAKATGTAPVENGASSKTRRQLRG